MSHFSFWVDLALKFESICGVYFKHKHSMWRSACDVEACLALSSEDAAEHEAISWLLCIRQLPFGSVPLIGKAQLKPLSALSICSCLPWLTARWDSLKEG